MEKSDFSQTTWAKKEITLPLRGNNSSLDGKYSLLLGRNHIPSPLTGEGEGGGVLGVNRIITLGKALRKRSTDAEQLLWSHLRMKQMEGLKFRRQQPIDKFIVDFVCFENRIIIEVDGGQHTAENNKDRERDSYLQQFGFNVLRFWNNEDLQNTNGVLETIRENCLSHPPLNPLPSREGKKSEAPVKGGERYPLV